MEKQTLTYMLNAETKDGKNMMEIINESDTFYIYINKIRLECGMADALKLASEMQLTVNFVGF